MTEQELLDKLQELRTQKAVETDQKHRKSLENLYVGKHFKFTYSDYPDDYTYGTITAIDDITDYDGEISIGLKVVLITKSEERFSFYKEYKTRNSQITLVPDKNFQIVKESFIKAITEIITELK